MAVTVKEFYRGIDGGQRNLSVDYLVEGTGDYVEALDECENQIPLFADNMPRENIALKEISAHRGKWKATATFQRGSSEKREPDTGSRPDIDGTGADKELFAFEVAVEPVKEYVPQVLPQAHYVPTGRSAIDFQGLNAVNGKSGAKFEGAEILRPQASFSLDYIPTNNLVTREYQDRVMELVGRVNTTTFRGYPRGEVLLVGASGESRNSADWQFNFRFRVAPNRSNLVIGDITVTEAYGWDLIWAYFEETIEEGQGGDAEKIVVPKPRQISVAHVYTFDDLNDLFLD